MRWTRLICGGLLIFGMSSGRPLCSQSSSVSPAAAGAPVVPLVSCAGDKVTVNASSSNLGSVLMGIQRCISAKIDFPAEANGKIIFDQIGPVSAEEVLNRILGNSDFDFVIQNSAADPSRIASVLVMARVGDKGAGLKTAFFDDPDKPMTAARKAFLAMHENAKPGGPTGDRENPDRTPAEAAASGGVEAPPPADASDPPAAPVAPQASGAAPKPSDDRIQAMQEMFEQRKRLMESSGTTPKN